MTADFFFIRGKKFQNSPHKWILSIWKPPLEIKHFCFVKFFFSTKIREKFCISSLFGRREETKNQKGLIFIDHKKLSKPRHSLNRNNLFLKSSGQIVVENKLQASVEKEEKVVKSIANFQLRFLAQNYFIRVKLVKKLLWSSRTPC